MAGNLLNHPAPSPRHNVAAFCPPAETFRPERSLPFPGVEIKNARPEVYKDFTSNDYLGLTASTELRSSFLEKLASEEHILGSRSVRLLDGKTSAHVRLEA